MDVLGFRLERVHPAHSPVGMEFPSTLAPPPLCPPLTPLVDARVKSAPRLFASGVTVHAMRVGSVWRRGGRRFVISFHLFTSQKLKNIFGSSFLFLISISTRPRKMLPFHTKRT